VAWRTAAPGGVLLSPIAAEMPETMNAIIGVRQCREFMVLANISGAMTMQATVLAVFSLFGTPWLLDRSLIPAGAITALAVLALFLMFRGQRSLSSVCPGRVCVICSLRERQLGLR
jgi:Ca2+/Na+ antiporter